MTGAGTAATGLRSLRAAASSGLPGWAMSCCCCAAKPTEAGGGAVRATTARSNMLGGGAPACTAAPRTLCGVGATDGTAMTGALTTMSRDTGTAALATDCDCTNTVVGTATTAPGIDWLAYTTLVTFELL